MLIRETKRNLTKKDQKWLCAGAAISPKRTVLQFLSETAWEVAGTLLPPGTMTTALYRPDWPVVIWRMCGRGGARIGYLVHVATDIKIDEAAVTWTDLLLDFWIAADGTMTILDQDEVEAARQAGTVAASILDDIESRAQLFQSRRKSYLRSAEAEFTRCGV